MRIIEKFKDPGGNWSIRVELTSLKSEFFFFDKSKFDSPPDEIIREVVLQHLNNLSDEEYTMIKPPYLKMLDNEYYAFIRDDWNKVLHDNGILPTGQTITIKNTNAEQNVMYLLYLKRINKQKFYDMAGEFDRYKRLIEDAGGLTGKVVYHDDI